MVAVKDSPKPPPVRITMTLPLINQAREVHFLVAGDSKRGVVRALRSGGSELPAARVSPESGSLTFWLAGSDRE